ncbi:hypothetical protein MMC20_007951 [Loxospora ochrophaea]|nr:hypothetical protein [Loxospora ochrophaea]
MWRKLLLVSFCTFSPSFAFAQSVNNYFIKPPRAGANDDFSQNPTWDLGSTQQISWQTNVTEYYIALFQQQTDGGIQGNDVFGNLPSSNSSFLQTTFADHELRSFSFSESDELSASFNSEPNSTAWQVSTQNFSLSTSNVFFFWLNPGAPSTSSFTSHYFYIARSAESLVSSSSSASSASLYSSTSSTSWSSSASMASTISTSSPATPSKSPTLPPSTSNGKSAGAEAGGAVGGVVVLLLAGLFCFVYFKKKKRQAQDVIQCPLSIQPDDGDESQGPLKHHIKGIEELLSEPPKSDLPELPALCDPYELPVNS